LVYVTHDQTEALTFADRVAVMYEGEMVQLGTPRELFEYPAHTFVGYFIGSPGMNFLDCRLDGDAAVVDGHRIALEPGLTSSVDRDAVTQIGIRPEHLQLGAGNDAGVPVTIGQ